MSALLNISRLEPGISRHNFDLTASELQLESTDVIDVLHSKITLNVDAHPGEIIARGKSETVLKLECARCLEPFEHKMVHDLVIVIKLMPKGQLEGVGSESSDDFFVVPDSTEEFDIAPVVRERLLISMPLKPLCDPECKGLCPKCGVNRNIETCDCTEGTTDERWSGLKKLRQEHGGN